MDDEGDKEQVWVTEGQNIVQVLLSSLSHFFFQNKTHLSPAYIFTMFKCSFSKEGVLVWVLKESKMGLIMQRFY